MNNSTLLLIALIVAAVLLYLLNPWIARQFQTSPAKARRRQLEETQAALLQAETRLEDWDAEVKKLKLRVVRLETEESRFVDWLTKTGPTNAEVAPLKTHTRIESEAN